MNTPVNPLDSLIAAKRAEVVDAERVLERLRIELTTLERAHAAVAETPAQRRRNGRQRGKGSGRGRSLSEGWKTVLFSIASHGAAGATSDQIQGYCVAAGIKIERDTLRGQMSNYVKRGYLERPQDGVFRLTAKGAAAAGMKSWTGIAGAPPKGEAP